MGAGHCVVRLVACLVGRERTRESNVVRYVRYVESIDPTVDQFCYRLII